MRWSLRAKILGVLSALLLSVVFAYLVLADRVFREDKELLVYDTNKSNTERLADELDSSIKRVIDKMEIISQLLSGTEHATELRLARSVFEKDLELLALQILRQSPAGEDGKVPPPKVIQQLISDKKLQSLNLKQDQLLNPAILDVHPYQPADSESVVVENRSYEGAILYLLRVPVRKEGPGTDQYFVQAVINGKNWLDYFQSNRGLARIFAVTSDGKTFADADLSLVLQHRDLSDLELIRKGNQQNLPFQLGFSSEGKEFLGVYRRTNIGSLVVASITEKSLALAASRLLLEKTVVLSLIIVTAVFLIALFFANSLSTPLLQLVNATHEIARGNFDATVQVQAGDEIGTLAHGFSNMAKELKTSRLLLEEYNRKLELKVQERTQELESKNVAIRQQQEVLLKTTRLAAVGEIAGQAAHEVLNPLTAMVSRLESLSQRLTHFAQAKEAPIPVFEAITQSWEKDLTAHGLDGWIRELRRPSPAIAGKSMAEEDLGNFRLIIAEFKKFTEQLGSDLKLLLSESHRISRIVDGMRGLSRAAKIKRRTDITQLIQDCVRVSEDLLKRYRIEIRTQFEQSPLFVMVEADEMRQVFSNLIKNSMDAIEEKRNKQGNSHDDGLIKISVRIRGESVSISLWDNGPGITGTNRERIFDSNFSTKGEAGTGFGLSICRRFVRECGGDLIIAQTELDRFTEFEITLPRIAEREKSNYAQS